MYRRLMVAYLHGINADSSRGPQRRSTGAAKRCKRGLTSAIRIGTRTSEPLANGSSQ